VIKATSEILKDDPLTGQDSRQLLHILDKNAGMAAQLLTRSDITAEWAPRQLCPLTLVDAAEWSRFLFQRIKKNVGLTIECEDSIIKTQISIDVHHLTTAIVHIYLELNNELQIGNPRARLMQKEDWIYLDCYWQGDSVTNSLLKRLKQSVPNAVERVESLSVEEMLNVHGAKLWPNHHLLPKGFTGLRLLLPSIDKSEVVSDNGRVTVLPESRPEFYDFNLFQQAGQNPELDKRPLTELTFTVFDTETTGLDPQGGDEIISIGAVRIVNGRLLREEYFEQLIDPRRSLPWASVKYHGIRPEMLKNQPFIEQVLPLFHEFARDTILLGHNVAFDMRMLQLKEEQCGIVFDNPVLDTMLLSAIVHPAHSKHTMNAIADRLGVQIVGRHTALGDAIATGEIFLKLLPLLTEMGIQTLQQARRLSEKTFYARLKY
jgi:DNA polymerase-3 subunit epsilon